MADLEKQERVVGNGDEEEEEVEEEEEEEQKGFLEGISVLDFDMLCSTVALQSQAGKWRKLENIEDDDEEGGEFRGVFRMWEGELLNCFDDPRIAFQSSCCPCYRFGKNMRRAGLGSCFLQGSVYLILAVSALFNSIAFFVTKRPCFIYLAAALAILLAAYLGFFRNQIRKKFNIRGDDSLLDDCVYHVICPCCTLSQESRTLEMSNVKDGIWHGRGDTICIGSVSEGKRAFFELHPPSLVTVKSPEPPTIHNSRDSDNQS